MSAGAALAGREGRRPSRGGTGPGRRRPLKRTIWPAAVSRSTITYLVAGACGVLGLGAFVGLILVPAVDVLLARLAAARRRGAVVYVLAAMVGVGVLGAGGVYGSGSLT